MTNINSKTNWEENLESLRKERAKNAEETLSQSNNLSLAQFDAAFDAALSEPEKAQPKRQPSSPTAAEKQIKIEPHTENIIPPLDISPEEPLELHSEKHEMNTLFHAFDTFDEEIETIDVGAPKIMPMSSHIKTQNNPIESEENKQDAIISSLQISSPAAPTKEAKPISSLKNKPLQKNEIGEFIIPDLAFTSDEDWIKEVKAAAAISTEHARETAYKVPDVVNSIQLSEKESDSDEQEETDQIEEKETIMPGNAVVSGLNTPSTQAMTNKTADETILQRQQATIAAAKVVPAVVANKPDLHHQPEQNSTPSPTLPQKDTRFESIDVANIEDHVSEQNELDNGFVNPAIFSIPIFSIERETKETSSVQNIKKEAQINQQQLKQIKPPFSEALEQLAQQKIQSRAAANEELEALSIEEELNTINISEEDIPLDFPETIIHSDGELIESSHDESSKIEFEGNTLISEDTQTQDNNEVQFNESVLAELMDTEDPIQIEITEEEKRPQTEVNITSPIELAEEFNANSIEPIIMPTVQEDTQDWYDSLSPDDVQGISSFMENTLQIEKSHQKMNDEQTLEIGSLLEEAEIAELLENSNDAITLDVANHFANEVNTIEIEKIEPIDENELFEQIAQTQSIAQDKFIENHISSDLNIETENNTVISEIEVLPIQNENSESSHVNIKPINTEIEENILISQNNEEEGYANFIDRIPGLGGFDPIFTIDEDPDFLPQEAMFSEQKTDQNNLTIPHINNVEINQIEQPVETQKEITVNGSDAPSILEQIDSVQEQILADDIIDNESDNVGHLEQESTVFSEAFIDSLAQKLTEPMQEIVLSHLTQQLNKELPRMIQEALKAQFKENLDTLKN